ncbi:MAG TPA: hypothetical protein ACFYD1_00530 [Candidatus Hypogeohydataceae bacterium YC38]|nr:hypothetical protein [Candidatus Brocadiales bacterium]
MIDLEKTDLGAWIGSQEGEAWVKFGETFELLLAYLSPRREKGIKDQHVTDPQQRRNALLSFGVRGWRGLTIKEFVELTKVDSVPDNLTAEDLKKEIPFSYDRLFMLADCTRYLEQFIELQCRNQTLFQPANWDALIKNLGSGENLNSPHEKRPA